MCRIILAGILVCVLGLGCTAPVRISGYPAPEAGNFPKEACEADYESVRVLGALPEDGTYIELGYMNVIQESELELVATSEEKQIREARIKACQWGADAIVIVGSTSDKGSTFSKDYMDRRETKIIAIRMK